MKIAADKLPQALERGRHPVYVVSGDDPLLVQEAGDLVREHLRSQGYSERELYHVEPRFDWGEVLMNANSMSLFADLRILEIRMPTAKIGDGAKVLEQYLAAPPDDAVLLIMMPRVDASTQKTKWFKSLEGAGLVVQVWPVDTNAFPGWLTQRCRRQGLEISREAIALLAERTEGNLLAAVQEIELLRLAAVDNRIDADLVMNGVADSARFDVFAMIDAAVAGDAARALRVAASLEAEGEALVPVNTMVGRELRSLAQMALEPSADAAVRKFRVWPKRQAIVKKALNRCSQAQLEALVKQSAAIDGMIKGYQSGNPWQALRDVAVGLATASQRPANRR